MNKIIKFFTKRLTPKQVTELFLKLFIDEKINKVTGGITVNNKFYNVTITYEEVTKPFKFVKENETKTTDKNIIQKDTEKC